MPHIPFDNTYATLPERFFSRVSPRPVAAPTLVRVNGPLCDHLGIDPTLFTADGGADFVTGNRVAEGADPIATVYAGHQFGQFNPQLGDGRAILLGEVVARDGVRHDLQLKGSGVTPYSRGGDGRSPLGPVLREYIVSEAMAALGIPTTRALAAAATGEPVQRQTRAPGGVLLRVAQSHVRVGTFEYFAGRRDLEGLQRLTDYVIARHYPDCAGAERPAIAMLREVAARQAALVARWQLVGFIHGVMNTDNMLVSGETIDYGPCAFMDAYDPATVYSAIDARGRYAYDRQPAIARWNLASLGNALLQLDEGQGEAALADAQSIIDGFPALHAKARLQGLGRKLGLGTEEPEDGALAEDLLAALHTGGADFTLAFRHLVELAETEGGDAAVDRETAGAGTAAYFEPPAEMVAWLPRWRARVGRDPRDRSVRVADMRTANPVVIPRNHLIEAAIRDAEDAGDFGRFHALVEVLARPHGFPAGERGAMAVYVRPPRPEECVAQTFCGT